MVNQGGPLSCETKAMDELAKSVYMRYLVQLKGLLAKIEDHVRGDVSVLDARLAENMLPLSNQVRTAADFALRACCPAYGLEPVSFADTGNTFAGLTLQVNQTLNFLAEIPDGSPCAASDEVITEKAGFAEVVLPAHEFVQLYALPNFFFHLSMAYAIARKAGVPLSKGDFDGFHNYPTGFSFSK